ncbi:adenosine kinase [Eurytemora carolleeae]|uniref:adenosine kinase n=1 Tax=Eurytemora carolleeae TaxID=1294199 RepID=UPI000C7806CE|nr:adenosine kinase [Eurytemora carolleeae]|eukprot:XP_023341038.1 adenosine kinase-like [Eurytemora affinis]
MAELLNEGILLGMGNPLLDISASVAPELLEKYKLKANDAILTEDEAIFKDLVDNHEVEYIAGGATQNSIRVAQWILGKPKATSYFGCVGADESRDKLIEKAEEAGVNVKYQISEHPTGRCAVLITGHERSLVTKLDAANHFTVSHLEDEDNWKLVQKAQVVYSAGFFLTVSVESMLKVAKYCAAKDRIYCMNLSAPFLCQFFKDQMASVLPFTDIIFGNETEAAAYAESQNLGTTDVKEIAKKIAMLPKENGSRSRIVIITQGKEPVVLVSEGQISEHPVEVLTSDQIIDTNGAGDAFVGGFLAMFVQKKPLSICIKCGVWAATQIIQRSGCTLPNTMDFKV